jgi:hypothetical protein
MDIKDLKRMREEFNLQLFNFKLKTYEMKKEREYLKKIDHKKLIAKPKLD